MGDTSGGSGPLGGAVIPGALHAELTAWVVSSLSPDERQDFRTGLRPLLERVSAAILDFDDQAPLPDHVAKEFTAAWNNLELYVRSWAMSAKLAVDAEWRAQMDASENVADARNLAGTDAAGLLSLLGV